ncbi:hypothetical protein MUCCIDRAFT_115812 [Mucor lusitanicus CBS 277.49]|uniref:Uncharacterized protein n=1 Tax=Mucor lusitanicus CBS 277.49 TaxID=747725 RepID=A0A168H216_MUCCL|nr:hypothetical protein MUCCIDRAFT_115812 [Mucor lusitanicus CBS 277.49]
MDYYSLHLNNTSAWAAISTSSKIALFYRDQLNAAIEPVYPQRTGLTKSPWYKQTDDTNRELVAIHVGFAKQQPVCATIYVSDERRLIDIKSHQWRLSILIVTGTLDNLGSSLILVYTTTRCSAATV